MNRKLSKRAAGILAALITASCLLLPGCFGKGQTRPEPSPEAAFSAAPSEALTEAPTAEPTPAPTEEPAEHRAVREALESMSLEEKIGQLMMFGFIGLEKPEGASKALFERFPIGNAVIFSSNIDRTQDGGFGSAKRLTEGIESEYPCPVERLFAADVEGGSVVRFNWEPKIPSPAKLGKKTSEEVRELFSGIGGRLTGCGIGLDLAPVFDIAEEPEKSFLGNRIISSDLETVISIGGAMIGGLHDGGCLSCAKHFPGHGGTGADSHSETPVVYRTRGELYDYDLAAFRGAIEAGADCVMTAHALYPVLDGENVATLSHTIITEILRGELGFDGVVISDDMLMQGVSSSCEPAEAALRFIEAGGDMILCGADPGVQESIFLALIEAVNSGRIDEARIDESAERVLRLKLRFD